MYAAYDLPKTSDLCCYWFEQARRRIEECSTAAPGCECSTAAPGCAPRVGLLATQGIRGGDNRTVLERINQAGGIFMAWSDREWILDGAAVHVSMVGFDDGTQKVRTLDRMDVARINPNLTGDADTTTAHRLHENASIGWSIGTQKGGPFEISQELARSFLGLPNPNGRATIDVVRPWRNGADVVRRPRGLWIIDFGPSMVETEASGFERPFEYVRRYVKPERDGMDAGLRVKISPRGAGIVTYRKVAGTP